MGSVLTDPAIMNVLDRQGVEQVPPVASFTLNDDQVCVFQHFKMLHDCAAVHVGKYLAQHASGPRLVL